MSPGITRLRSAMPRRAQSSDAPPHLPIPPNDDEKYSYFGAQRRWPFIWLFVAQALLISAYASVMAHSPTTSLGLIFLTFLVPPLLVNLWLRVRKRRVSLEAHIVTIEKWRKNRVEFPSVDVFIPCCGEDPSVLENTFRHVGQLEWPGRRNIYILDDAADAVTNDLARCWNLDYIARPNRGEWKKAGNLIHAFDRTNGEFVVVFDADFVPRPDFLWETIPYMDERRTGVLQTAQYFDVDGRVNEFARYAGTLQELFFRWIQPARDTYEAAICAGTNVVYRRSAVVAAGGYAKVPLGEDVHSGVKIWVANYRTRYLPLILAKGLAPDTWSALTNQQYRWCRSSMLLMVSGFFRDAPFGLRQRICFWAAFLYYMASAAVVVTSVLPTLIMIWFYPKQVVPSHYLPMIPAIVATLVIFPLLARGWRPTIFRVCMINTFCHLQAVVDALRNQVKAWVPTGAAGGTVRRKRAGVPRRIATIGRTWFVVTQGLLWSGIARHLTSGADPFVLWPTIALGLVQVYMLAPVLIRLAPTPSLIARPRSEEVEATNAREGTPAPGLAPAFAGESR